MWHRLAIQRRGIERDGQDLRQLNNLQLAVGSALSKDGVRAFNDATSKLLARLNGKAKDDEDAPANRRTLVNRLLNMGVTRGWEKAA